MARSSVATIVACAAILATAGCAAPLPAGHPTHSGQVDGALLDLMLHPIGSTPVYLLERGMKDITSPLGGFTFRSLPAGNYTLVANAPGMKGIMHTLHVDEGQTTRVILQLAPIPAPAGEIRSAHTSQTFHVPRSGEQADLSTVDVAQRPDDIDLVATWHGSLDTPGDALSPPHLEVQLWDSAGELLGHAEDGSGMVHVRVDMSRMSNGTQAVYPRVVFLPGDGLATSPQPEVQVDVTTNLYYGTTHDELLGLGGSQ